MNMIGKYIISLIPIFFIIISSCDGSGGNGPPDNVAGTWVGSISESVDTTVVFSDGRLFSASGEVTRTFTLVIAESKGNLDIDIQIVDSGSFRGGPGDNPSEYDSEPIDASVEFNVGGTYGPPMMIVDLSDVSSDFLEQEGFLYTGSWRFDVRGNNAETEIDFPIGHLKFCAICEQTVFEQAIDANNGEDFTLNLERQR